MASVRGILNIQSLNELTYEKPRSDLHLAQKQVAFKQKPEPRGER